MATPNVKLQVGKIRSTGSKYPWEPGYVAAVNAQCKDLEKVISSICEQFVDVTPDLLIEALKPTKELADSYCPKDTHRLVESGYLENVGFRGQPRVELGYARGGNPHYAVLVHEDLNMRHAPPTQAKWLERAIDEDIANIATRIGDNYRAFMNG